MSLLKKNKGNPCLMIPEVLIQYSPVKIKTLTEPDGLSEHENI